mmetsp:Transcript_5763/g.18764  ORF Transcript_5763/g.18764 Transcript_5763/m.18764 type:complete len:289 (-) Transcript_5763:1126-1992(-)
MHPTCYLDALDHEAGIGEAGEVGDDEVGMGEAVEGVEGGGDGAFLPARQRGELVADDEEDRVFGLGVSADGGALGEVVEVRDAVLHDVPLGPAALDVGHVLPGDGDAMLEAFAEGRASCQLLGAVLAFGEALFDGPGAPFLGRVAEVVASRQDALLVVVARRGVPDLSDLVRRPGNAPEDGDDAELVVRDVVVGLAVLPLLDARALPEDAVRLPADLRRRRQEPTRPVVFFDSGELRLKDGVEALLEGGVEELDDFLRENVLEEGHGHVREEVVAAELVAVGGANLLD